MSPIQQEECCVDCDAYTGRAGASDDSLFLDDGRGPFCELCYYRGRIEELEKELARFREKLLDKDTQGRIMHESWTQTKRAQGFHGPREYCNTAIELDRGQHSEYTTCKVVGDVCPKYHRDLIPWEQLPEKQKDINRHAFDALIAYLTE